MTREGAAIKVPAVTADFWIINFLATTLGETGGEAVSMSMGVCYLVSTGIFLAIFIAAVVAQISASKFHLLLVQQARLIQDALETTCHIRPTLHR